MTREEAKKHYSISTGNEWDFEKFIDKIYDDFEKGIVAEFEAHGTNCEIYFEDSQLIQHEIITTENTDGKKYKIIIKDIDDER